MVGRRKLPDPSLNHIFNALSIGVQYTLSFQLTNFSLKCLQKRYIMDAKLDSKYVSAFWSLLKSFITLKYFIL